MSQFADKIFKGEKNTEQEWIDYLKEAHKAVPGMTAQEFGILHDENGLNSYEILAQQIKKDMSDIRRILDLACGDGHLLKILDGLWDNPVQLTGIDMSEHELALAEQKTYKNQVQLKCEMADKLSASAGFYDAVSCHMAFMLMNSANLVAKEIHRVLKPGGVFVAVVGGARKSSEINFTTAFRNVFSSFMKDKFPAFVWPMVGDERVNSPEGLSEIFSPAQFKDVSVRPFVVSAAMTPERAWECYRTTYFVSAMTKDAFEEIHQLFLKEARIAKQQKLSFTLNLITCRKL